MMFMCVYYIYIYINGNMKSSNNEDPFGCVMHNSNPNLPCPASTEASGKRHSALKVKAPQEGLTVDGSNPTPPGIFCQKKL